MAGRRLSRLEVLPIDPQSARLVLTNESDRSRRCLVTVLRAEGCYVADLPNLELELRPGEQASGIIFRFASSSWLAVRLSGASDDDYDEVQDFQVRWDLVEQQEGSSGQDV